MKLSFLLLAAALLCLGSGCQVVTKKSSERVTFSNPQTGTNIGRRVAPRAQAQQQQRRRSQATARARAAEEQRRERAKRQRQETVVEDFVPRGGFR
jgi:hypothetical protein